MKERIGQWLQLLGRWLSTYVEYIIFVILIFAKLYLFTKLTGTSFTQAGLVAYFEAVKEYLFNGGDFTPVRKGVVMVSFGAIILSSFWVFLLPRRGRILSLTILYGILTFIILADTIYFRYFEDIISTTVLLQIKQVTSLGSSISSLFSFKDLLYILDLIILIPLAIFLFKWMKPNKMPKLILLGRFANAAIFFAFGYYLAFYPVHVFVEKGGGYLFEKTISNMRMYEVTGLLGFHGYETYKYIDENFLNKKVIAQEDREHVKHWFGEHQKVLQEETPFYGIAKGKNVILVQLESFQNSVINQSIKNQEITPNLNKIIKDSMYFPNYYHQTASGRTSDGEFLTQTSLYPLSSGSAYIKYSDNVYTALPETLKQNGYETAAFHAYKPSFWNRYIMYQTLGIDTFHSIEDFEDSGDKIGWSITDESMLQQSLGKLKEMKEPYFSFLITLSSHHPYEIPEKYKYLDLTGYNDHLFKNYIQSVHYTDKAVGEFVDGLKKTGVWDDSIVIFYGDHDSGLMSEGSEMAKFSNPDGTKLGYYQAKENIPFIIHLPNDEKAGVYKQVGGQIDTAPTILHLLGITPKNLYMMGKPIFNTKDRLVVFRYGSFTTDEVFYNASFDGKIENGTCFDVKTKKETSLSRCQEPMNEAHQQLDISDFTIYGDLIRKEA